MFDVLFYFLNGLVQYFKFGFVWCFIVNCEVFIFIGKQIIELVQEFINVIDILCVLGFGLFNRAQEYFIYLEVVGFVLCYDIIWIDDIKF